MVRIDEGTDDDRLAEVVNGGSSVEGARSLEHGSDIPSPIALAVAESTNSSFGIFATKMAL